MGNALVVMVVPEEVFMLSNLAEPGPDGTLLRVYKEYPPDKWMWFRRHREHLYAHHPNAGYFLRVTEADVWSPPPEPRSRRDIAEVGGGKLRIKHRRAVRASLDEFLNDKLRRLDRMVRTGWWILERARVRVSKLTGVGIDIEKGPEPELEPGALLDEMRRDVARVRDRLWIVGRAGYQAERPDQVKLAWELHVKLEALIKDWPDEQGARDGDPSVLSKKERKRLDAELDAELLTQDMAGPRSSIDE